MNFEEILAFATRSPFNQILSLSLVGLTVAIVYTEISRLFRGYKALRPAELPANFVADPAPTWRHCSPCRCPSACG